ncbi:phage integrase central domain-containing protein [Paraburkholderia susongensis]
MADVEPAQHAKTLARMESDVFPWLGKRPITGIDAPDILGVRGREAQGL